MEQIEHDPDCTAPAEGYAPRLIISMAPSRSGDTVRMSLWEECPGCLAHVVYASQRVPLRRFHREWRGSLATWIATWEHRHQIWGRLTLRS